MRHKLSKELLEDIAPELLETEQVKYFLFSHIGPERVYAITLDEEQRIFFEKVFEPEKFPEGTALAIYCSDREDAKMGLYSGLFVHENAIHVNKGTMLVSLHETYDHRMNKYYAEMIKEFKERHEKILKQVNELNLEM